ncbi:bifunctional methylenetetrahydrofolate dehydrogenase/methenyltetrahydrofolate cyclohydrolase [Pacificimonas flava]|uniref:Bifunctional protein FolD n=2 Tax=Pacificimonas TaxID=1960290 RepID=A0A219B420_9SPHN|nr:MULTISPECIES: bifunctional methylenetetrahydrofolate dehydrogenase/methenyltetrahydrofolate cyclohydrolase FolD [Pacificimonas]MBZ6377414.1 bifunctional methylenetetrahydrofolate dehydrogenase/methenyltetrahydrofolate cyclohydrolase FolD [Pacificimonas aurantium]OWV32883.1 bifunctional methylenetetrahydrofolate dehydrogenase/methenyltetrahydrofolate cyclohydrolase [Pacificimonas flava]
MPAERIDGKAFAADMRAKAAEAARAFEAQAGRRAGLAVVLVGDDPASDVYVRSKVKTTMDAGMESFEHRLPETTGEDELLALVDSLNADDKVDGILVQLPLPRHLDSDRAVQRIDPDKDVDGLTVVNAGRLISGLPGIVPCTPMGCDLMISQQLGGDLSGKLALVIGRSNLFGKPMGQLLLQRNATVIQAHSRTADLPDLTRMADILVVAVGRPEMVKGDWVKPGAVVIDVGINRIPAPERGEGKTRLLGDVAYEEAAKAAAAITPVPGGVGPTTVAGLLLNTVKAAHRRAGLTAPAL